MAAVMTLSDLEKENTYRYESLSEKNNEAQAGEYAV